MKKILLIISIFLGASLPFQSIGQTNIKTLKAEAYKLFNENNFVGAIGKLKECQQLEPNNSEILTKLSSAYLNTHNMRENAIVTLESVAKKSIDPNLIYQLGLSYHKNNRFQEAIESFEKYSELTRKTGIYESTAKKYIQQCKAGLDNFSKNGTESDNIGPTFNTQFDEWSPIFNSDDSQIMFASNRPGVTGGKQNSKLKADENGIFYSDIFYSSKVDGGWNVPKNAGDKINTNNHEVPLCFLPGDQFVYFSKIEGKADVNIHQIKYQAEEFGAIEKLEEPIYSNAYEGACSLSPDGKNLYFVSSRPGGIGGKDIYVSFKAPNGKWSEPKNLGPSINTPFDEDSPSLAADGTLYFSSNGSKSMGGFDLFSTQFKNGAWLPVTNLGFGINTVDDEQYITLSKTNKNLIYFSSNRINSLGGLDIYSADLTKKEDIIVLQTLLNENNEPVIAAINPENQIDEEKLLAEKKAAEEKIKEEKLLAEKKAAEEKAKLEADAKTKEEKLLAEKKAAEEKAKLEADAKTKEEKLLAEKKAAEEKALIDSLMADHTENTLETIIDSAKNSAELSQEQLDSLFNAMDNFETTINENLSKELSIDVDSVIQAVDSVMNIILARGDNTDSVAAVAVPKPKPTVNMKNIYYEYNQSKLTDESINTLQQLELTMKYHKNLIIGLMGHTDSRGSNEYNTELAQRRVIAIKNFLVEKGINEKRISVLGFGEYYPYAMNNIDTTDLVEGRSANRHVEVRLMNPDSASVLWKTVHYTLPLDYIIQDRTSYENEFQGLFYRIEIMQSKTPINPRLIKGFDRVYTEGVNANTTAYLVGKYATYAEALKEEADVKYKKQITSTRIIPYFNGLRIKLDEAKQLETK